MPSITVTIRLGDRLSLNLELEMINVIDAVAAAEWTEKSTSRHSDFR